MLWWSKWWCYVNWSSGWFGSRCNSLSSIYCEFSCLWSQIIRCNWSVDVSSVLLLLDKRSKWCYAAAPRKTSLAFKASERICESFWIRLGFWAAWNPLSNWETSAIALIFGERMVTVVSFQPKTTTGLPVGLRLHQCCSPRKGKTTS